MFQFYVFEVQKYADGTFGHIVHPIWDEDEKQAKLKAESKWHEVLTAAAISDLPIHSATIIPPEGWALKSECYTHDVATDE